MFIFCLTVDGSEIFTTEDSLRMQKYIIDANLPYYFSLWRGEAYEHVIDIDPHMKDSEI